MLFFLLFCLFFPFFPFSFPLQLLNRDPTKRLGGGPRDAKDIKEHAFWRGLDFEAVMRREVEVTYKPVLANARDTNNFDSEFTREVPRLTPVDSVLTDADQEDFVGFSYVSEWAQASIRNAAAVESAV